VTEAAGGASQQQRGAGEEVDPSRTPSSVETGESEDSGVVHEDLIAVREMLGVVGLEHRPCE
jgi:hypothetical protein